MDCTFIFAGLYELRVTPEGFTLWDSVDGRWLIDASCIRDDGRFRVGRCTAKQIRDAKEPNPTYVMARLNANVAKSTAPNVFAMPKPESFIGACDGCKHDLPDGSEYCNGCCRCDSLSDCYSSPASA